jgi:alpha-tubulin suppressor-like RCC1 family protein
VDVFVIHSLLFKDLFGILNFFFVMLQVVLDRKERVFTWGFGGYGRLGHDDNKDELVPRMVKFFDGPNRGAKSIGAGSTFTVAVNKAG